MIEAYNAKNRSQNWLWCPITHQWRSSHSVVAAHFFGYMHGKEQWMLFLEKGETYFLRTMDFWSV